MNSLNPGIEHAKMFNALQNRVTKNRMSHDSAHKIKEAVMFPPAFNPFDSAGTTYLQPLLFTHLIKEILDEGFALTEVQIT